MPPQSNSRAAVAMQPSTALNLRKGGTDVKFFESQNKILQKGIALGLLPEIGNLNDLWIK